MRPTGQAGSATPVVLALAAVLALVGAACTALGVVATTRHRAASAADLGALAAAGHALEGDGCARAAGVVEAAGARLLSCRLVGAVARVEVAVRPAGPLAALGAARAVARAGPAG